MTTIRDLAKISSMAYHTEQTQYNEWTKVSQSGNPSGKGFYSVIFRNQSTDEFVLGIRGTDGDSKDWSDFMSDVEIAAGTTPSQFAAAKQAYEKAKGVASRLTDSGFKLYLTGHSLGGGLASLLSASKGGLPTVTFNAPGMKRAYVGGYIIPLVGQFNLSYVKTNKMIHIRATGDVVSKATGPHMGKVTDVYVDKWGDDKILGASRHLAQHSIDNMFEAMANIPWTQEDLGWNKEYYYY